MLRRNAFRWGLFLFFFLTEFALGFYISYIVGYMHSDALSRVANAFYVLYSRDPHLGAIGFVWNPLPSLMELIVLVLYPILPELASYGLAGVLVTSIFAGLTALLLYDAGRRNGLSFGMSLGLSLLYCLNPFIFLFGANGLSDAPYIYFLMYTVIRFGDWLKTRQISHLVLAGFALSLAFWTRYEAVPFGVSLGVALLIVLLLMPPGEGERPLPWAERGRKVEATAYILLLPAVFSGLLWIFFNYIIMGDALYFLHSEYSNQAQSDALKADENFSRIFNSPLLALVFVAKKTAWFSAPLAAVLLIRTFAGRLLRWETLVLLCLFLSIPGLQFVLLMKESSFGWFRYFMYVYPITVAWIPYELGLLRKRRAAFTVAAAGLLATSALLSYAVTNPQIAPDENTFLTIKSGNKYYQSQILDRSVAKWLDEHMGDATILTDSASAFTILVNSRNTKKFLITSDFAFNKAKNDPPGNGVDYILIPRPLPNADKSAINTKYKDLYEKGNEWAELYHDFDNEWRLYKIKKWQPPAS